MVTREWGPDPVRFIRPLTDTVAMNELVGDEMGPQRLDEIKRLVAHGEYRIDPHQIAEAMIRWAQFELDPAIRRDRREPQNVCSKPDIPSSASVKNAAAGPSVTDPIHVRLALALGQAA